MARRSATRASAAPIEDMGWLEGDLPVDDPCIVDKHGLAALLGEPIKTVDRFVREGMPLHGERSRGTALRFSVPQCVQWLLARHGDPVEEAKRRAASATARKREAEAARLEGESIGVDVAEAVIRDAAARAQARLLLIPPRFPDQREALEAEIVAAINELAAVRVPT